MMAVGTNWKSTKLKTQETTQWKEILSLDYHEPLFKTYGQVIK